MSQHGTITPEYVDLRAEEGGFVADVRGGEAMVDQNVKIAADKKAAEKLWDGSKEPFRDFAGQVRVIADKAGKPIKRTNFLGLGPNIIEVEYSHKRKQLSADAIKAAKEGQFPDLLVEEDEVVLRGELADWVVKALGDRTGKDPRFSRSKKVVLSPKFEEIAREQRASGLPTALDMINTLEQAGVYASAVEAKVVKGSK